MQPESGNWESKRVFIQNWKCEVQIPEITRIPSIEKSEIFVMEFGYSDHLAIWQPAEEAPILCPTVVWHASHVDTGCRKICRLPQRMQVDRKFFENRISSILGFEMALSLLELYRRLETIEREFETRLDFFFESLRNSTGRNPASGSRHDSAR